MKKLMTLVAAGFLALSPVLAHAEEAHMGHEHAVEEADAAAMDAEVAEDAAMDAEIAAEKAEDAAEDVVAE